MSANYAKGAVAASKKKDPLSVVYDGGPGADTVGGGGDDEA